eukprot:12638924-Alexandrium_andersonii.AAC.1
MSAITFPCHGFDLSNHVLVAVVPVYAGVQLVGLEVRQVVVQLVELRLYCVQAVLAAHVFRCERR